MRAGLRWLVYALIGSVIEAEALRHHRHDRTLSHATRTAFRTQTPAGKVAFTLAWAALSFWFVPHIVQGVKDVADASSSS